MSNMRMESDSMGQVAVPAEALYGAQTQRAIDNFPISSRRFSRPFLRMLGQLKYAAAAANKKLNLLEAAVADAIMAAADEVARGEHAQHFPLDIFQTGSGTSTNMNANEVIANLANVRLGGQLGAKAPVHPNDHVNKGQSSNDVIPTVIHLAALAEITTALLPALEALQRAFENKAKEFDHIVKIGRTHLMDATPIRLGQEFSGYARQVQIGIEAISATLPLLRELPIGGTAVGTGINTHPQFAQEVCATLNRRLSLSVSEAANHFAAQGGKDACVAVSGGLKTAACALFKIADDIRWLASGPRAGLAEIILPELQPGSSIMPGKVNPVIPEVVTQVATQVIANDAGIAVAAAAGGRFELNVMMPIIASNLLESVEILASAAKMFVEKCVSGIAADERRCEQVVEHSLMLATPLALHIGYDKAAAIAKRAYAQGKTIREVALEEKVMDAEELSKVLDVRTMTQPG